VGVADQGGVVPPDEGAVDRRADGQLRDDPPVVGLARQLLVGVLDPDNGDLFLSRLLDKAADVGDDRVALVRPLDDADSGPSPRLDIPTRPLYFTDELIN
jgi:hypothetical protein